MQKILFIINPIAGGRSKYHLPDMIRNTLEREKFEIHIGFTSYKGHAQIISQESVKAGFDIIVAVGGDGSINEVASPLVASPVKLAILPTGSGNGLATKLGIPMDISAALQRINRNYTVPIDVGTMNDRYFFSTAGMGFEALIVYDFADTRMRGMAGYADKVIRRLFNYEAETYSVAYNGITKQEKAFIITFGNSGVYGYGIGITSRQSRMDDGWLEMAIMRDFPRWKAAYLLTMAAQGKANQLKEVKINMVKDALVSTHRPLFTQIDGEPAGLTDSMKIGIVPKGLQVIV